MPIHSAACSVETMSQEGMIDDEPLPLPSLQTMAATKNPGRHASSVGSLVMARGLTKADKGCQNSKWFEALYWRSGESPGLPETHTHPPY